MRGSKQRFASWSAGVVAAGLVSGVASPARAAIVWNWTADGGAYAGTFTTTGSNAAPLPAGNYVIADAAITKSSVMPVGSLSNGFYGTGVRGASGPYFIAWNGSAVTNIDATTTTRVVNGLDMLSIAGRVGEALFGADRFGNDGPTRFSYYYSGGSQPLEGNDLSTVPVLAVPEPAALSLAATVSMALLGLRRRRRPAGR